MNRQRILGDIAVTCFIVVQFADWLATYHGVTLFGTGIEANPLLRRLMERYDIILVLTSAKLFATVAGSFLHLLNRHFTVALLAVLYTAFAILPWFRVLSMGRVF
jgi:hypothetical protein